MKTPFHLKTSLLALAVCSGYCAGNVSAQAAPAKEAESPPVAADDMAVADIVEARKTAFAKYAADVKKQGGEDRFSKPLLVQKGMEIKPSKYQINETDAMPYVVLQRGAKMPEGGWPLYIAMHSGGGNGKAKGPHSWSVNSREWNAQMQLSATRYPDNGIYFIPRMVDDRRGRWWMSFNTIAFDAMIKHAILNWDVNPNKVYMLGISEGGYGTEVLACIVPDKLAAANGMACGSGTSIHVENLRNLPFRTDVGEHDKAFGRVDKAIAKHKLINTYKEKNATDYVNEIKVHKGRGHGIDYSPGPAWLTKHTRNPHPARVTCTLFKTDASRNTGSYWVQAQNDLGNKDIYIDAAIVKATNSITVTAKATKVDGKYQAPDWQQALADAGELVPAKGLKLRLWLHESQLDLSKPVMLKINGKASEHKVKLSKKSLAESISKFGDPNYAYPSYVDVEVK